MFLEERIVLLPVLPDSTKDSDAHPSNNNSTEEWRFGRIQGLLGSSGKNPHCWDGFRLCRSCSRKSYSSDLQPEGCRPGVGTGWGRCLVGGEDRVLARPVLSLPQPSLPEQVTDHFCMIAFRCVWEKMLRTLAKPGKSAVSLMHGWYGVTASTAYRSVLPKQTWKKWGEVFSLENQSDKKEF